MKDLFKGVLKGISDAIAAPFMPVNYSGKPDFSDLELDVDLDDDLDNLFATWSNGPSPVVKSSMNSSGNVSTSIGSISLNGVGTGTLGSAAAIAAIPSGSYITGHVTSSTISNTNTLSGVIEFVHKTCYGNLSKRDVETLEILLEENPDAVVAISKSNKEPKQNGLSTGTFTNASINESNVRKSYEEKKKMISAGVDVISVYLEQLSREVVDELPEPQNNNMNPTGAPSSAPIGSSYYDVVTQQVFIMTPTGWVALAGLNGNGGVYSNSYVYPVRTTTTHFYDLVILNNEEDIKLLEVIGLIRLDSVKSLKDVIVEIKKEVH
jgi:hypothetical protein